MAVAHCTYTGLELDVRLPVPAEVAWPVLTEPNLMNRWSTAPIRAVEAGDGGGYGAVGALREVVLPGLGGRMAEVIQQADPPHRLVYRAVGSRAIRHHRGELRLRDIAGGSRLTWTVELALAMPAAERPVRRILLRALSRSLRQLVTLLDDPPEVEAATPTRRFPDDDPAAALAEAEETAQAQGELADALAADDDPRHWFARVYQYVTEAMIDAVHGGEVVHRAWALRLIPRFHVLFAESLAGSPSPHWQHAYAAVERAAAHGSSALSFWQALIAGARAHIEGDLPITLAEVYRECYAGRCDYARFRADFLLLAAPLQVAWQRLAAEIPPRWFPAYLRVLSRALPDEAIEHLTAKRFYDPLSARRLAFKEGHRLASREP